MKRIKKWLCIAAFFYLGIMLFAPRKPLSVPEAVLTPSAKVFSDEGKYTGSGVIINDRYVLTAAHVITYPNYSFFIPDDDKDFKPGKKIPDRKIKIEIIFKTPDGRNAPLMLPVKTILYDRNVDLALLEVPYTFNTPASFPWFGWDRTYEGCPLWIIGASHGLSQKLTTLGYLDKKSGNCNSFAHQSSNITHGGNSGGGVYNANTNNLVGILVCGRGIEISEYISLGVILEFLDKLNDSKNYYKEDTSKKVEEDCEDCEEIHECEECESK